MFILLLTSCSTSSIKNLYQSFNDPDHRIGDIHFRLESVRKTNSEKEKKILGVLKNNLVNRNLPKYNKVFVTSDAFTNWDERNLEDDDMVKFIDRFKNNDIEVYGFCSANVKESASIDYLKRCLNLHPKIKGVKLHLSGQSNFCVDSSLDKFLDFYKRKQSDKHRTQFKKILKYLNSLDKKHALLVHAKYDCPSYEAEAKQWIKTIEQHSNIIFIMAHIGNLDLLRQSYESEIIKKNKNVYFDTSVSNLYINDEYLMLKKGYYNKVRNKDKTARFPYELKLNIDNVEEFKSILNEENIKYLLFGSNNQPMGLNCSKSYIKDPNSHTFKSHFEQAFGDYVHCQEGPNKKNNLQFLSDTLSKEQLHLITTTNFDRLLKQLN